MGDRPPQSASPLRAGRAIVVVFFKICQSRLQILGLCQRIRSQMRTGESLLTLERVVGLGLTLSFPSRQS